MWRRLALVGLVGSLAVLGACVGRMVTMPGASYQGPPGAPDAALEATLRADVEWLSSTLGERNVGHTPAALDQAAAGLEQRLSALGYTVQSERWRAGAHEVRNLIAERRGATRPGEVVVVGAHYDSAEGTPGADDNASGVAVGLALAGAFASRQPARTVRFVFFANEEPPFFNTPGMGSEVSARAARARGDDIRAMLALETMGTFSDSPDTQHYPWPLSAAYPSTGNFIAFVGDSGSGDLVREAVRLFRAKGEVPSEGAAVPAFIEGVDWSDHGPYARAGYPALMVTDTAPFRTPHYHEATDVPAHLDFRRLALVTQGLVGVVAALAE